MMKKAFIVLFTLLLSLSLFADTPKKGTEFGLKFGYNAPMGAFKDTFNPGMGFAVFGQYYTSWDFLLWEGEFNYQKYDLASNTLSGLSSLSLTAGPVLYKYLHPYFQPFVGILGGARYLIFDLTDIKEKKSYLRGAGILKAGIMLSPGRALDVRLEGAYSINQFSNDLFQNYSVSLSTMLRTDFFSASSQLGRKESLVHITDIKLNPIFGARYGDYKESPIGRLTIENVGRNPLLQVKVEADIDEITEKPTATRTIRTLKPGEKAELDIPLAITREILTIQEDRDLPIRFKVIYKTKRGIFSYVEHETILVHSKNSITWDNTAHLGSFITPKEKTISSFAREAISQYKEENVKGFPKKIQQAMYLFDALGARQIAYVTDPSTGFATLRARKNVIDYVMFPRETLAKKAGDCDDLTTLYASLLESIGIRTAIVTIPGHVFMMFDTEIPANSFRNITQDKSLIYEMNGTCWIPVETTMVGRIFMDAWKNGASHVNKYKRGRDLVVIETANMWTKYPPTDLGSDSSISLPSKEKINSLYALDLDVMKSIGYDDLLKTLFTKVKRNPKDVSSWNKIGVVHAKYGDLDKAMENFNQAIKKNNKYASAYANSGNVAILKKDYEKAIKYFTKALQLKPRSHKYRISLARAYFEVGKKFKAKREYEIASKRYPGYKRQYEYLSARANVRAADPEERREYNLWAD